MNLRMNNRVAENEAHLAHPNIAAFLKAIAAAEGGGYDFKYGALKGRSNDRWRFTDTSTHPGPGIDGKTTAAGMYQITRPTWHGNPCCAATARMSGRRGLRPLARPALWCVGPFSTRL